MSVQKKKENKTKIQRMNMTVMIIYKFVEKIMTINMSMYKFVFRIGY